MSEDNKQSKAKAKRSNYYVAIGYPESLKENWKDILTETHVPFVISPLHNMDVNEGTGELKKEHYHFMALFESLKSLEQAQEIFDSINCTKCQAVKSLRGSLRYFCHLDNPDKAQYKIEDVICLNGADYDLSIRLPSDDYVELGEIVDFLEEHKVRSYHQFIQYCRKYKANWFILVVNRFTYVIKEEIKSINWHFENNIPFDNELLKLGEMQQDDINNQHDQEDLCTQKKD